MTIYLFSGLGADKRIYSAIDLTQYKVKHIHWIVPNKNESIEKYAQRLSTQIDDSGKCIFIGTSFGGIIALEISKYIKPFKIILISSIKQKNEMPYYFRWFRNIKWYKLLSDKKLTSSNRILNYFFGIKKDQDKELLANIMKDSDPDFIRWAIKEITQWNNQKIYDNLIHIHGDKDRIFPIKYIKPNYLIKNARHFMIVENSNQIQNILINIIQDK